MRGRLGGLFCGAVPELAWRDGEKPQGTLVKIVLLLWFELGTLNVSHLNYRWAYCRRRRHHHHNHRHRHNCHYHDQQIYCLKFQDSSVQEELIFHERALYGGRISRLSWRSRRVQLQERRAEPVKRFVSKYNQASKCTVKRKDPSSRPVHIPRNICCCVLSNTDELNQWPRICTSLTSCH